MLALRLARAGSRRAAPTPARSPCAGRSRSRSTPGSARASRPARGRPSLADRLLEAAGALGVGVAVGGQPHQLVLAGVHPEAEVVGERGVEQADGVREAQLAQDLDAVAPAVADRRGRPLADAVDRSGSPPPRRARGRTRSPRARGGARGRAASPRRPCAPRGARAPASSSRLSSSFSLIQTGIAARKERRPRGREGVVGLEQPLELEEGLVVEGDRLELLEARCPRPRGSSGSRSPGRTGRACGA